MFNPDDSPRVSVIHSRPSVICDPNYATSEKHSSHSNSSMCNPGDARFSFPPQIPEDFEKDQHFGQNYSQAHQHFLISKARRENESKEEMKLYNPYKRANLNPLQYENIGRWRKTSEGSYSESSENSYIKEENPSNLKSEPLPKEKSANKPVSNCHVCGDMAVAHMHYGGVCCYSCKAFFRRATQTGKDKKYVCKRERRCLVTHNNRRACQYCRFQKCLAIGMKPNWVLSDEQCNIRFRNMRKEKNVSKDKNTHREGFHGDEIEMSIKKENPEVDQGLVMPFTNEEAKSIEFMIESYNTSKETFVFSEENDVLWKKLFKDAQADREKHNYTSFDLSSLIMTVIKKNIFFVKTNDKFNDMGDLDKICLLQKNMSEMCHLRGAIRFDTKSKNFVWYFSKKDQQQIAFEKGSENQGSSQVNGSSSRVLQNALIGRQDMSKFYKDSTSQQIFKIVNKLCEIGLPMEVFLILIMIVLFASDNIVLENRKEAENNQTAYMLLLHRYLNELFGVNIARMKLSQIMGALVELRELCERSKEEKLQSQL